jgi:hypothetical protein
MMISRRIIQTVLGVIWLIDGLLQLKPDMFTNAFMEQVVLPTSQSQPAWITSVVHFGARLVLIHPTVWNASFALIQIIIGLGLILNVKVRTTIVASLVWTLIVWAFGEGFGQLLTGQALLLNGAPGAVLLYGFIGIAIWPDEQRSPDSWRASSVSFARYALGFLWIMGCALHFQPQYVAANALPQAMSISWLAKLIGGSGQVVSIAMGVLEFVIGVSLLLNVRVRSLVWISIVLSFLFWWIGQSFGQIFTPLATDFNSGLLIIVLSLCAYPALGNRWSNPFGTISPLRADQ